MKSDCKERGRRLMKPAHGILGITLALALSGSNARAQAPADATKPGLESVRTFYLTNVSQTSDANELTNALRNLLDVRDKVLDRKSVV